MFPNFHSTSGGAVQAALLRLPVGRRRCINPRLPTPADIEAKPTKDFIMTTTGNTADIKRLSVSGSTIHNILYDSYTLPSVWDYERMISNEDCPDCSDDRQIRARPDNAPAWFDTIAKDVKPDGPSYVPIKFLNLCNNIVRTENDASTSAEVALTAIDVFADHIIDPEYDIDDDKTILADMLVEGDRKFVEIVRAALRSVTAPREQFSVPDIMLAEDTLKGIISDMEHGICIGCYEIMVDDDDNLSDRLYVADHGQCDNAPDWAKSIVANTSEDDRGFGTYRLSQFLAGTIIWETMATDNDALAAIYCDYIIHEIEATQKALRLRSFLKTTNHEAIAKLIWADLSFLRRTKAIISDARGMEKATC